MAESAPSGCVGGAGAQYTSVFAVFSPALFHPISALYVILCIIRGQGQRTRCSHWWETVHYSTFFWDRETYRSVSRCHSPCGAQCVTPSCFPSPFVFFRIAPTVSDVRRHLQWLSFIRRKYMTELIGVFGFRLHSHLTCCTVVLNGSVNRLARRGRFSCNRRTVRGFSTRC